MFCPYSCITLEGEAIPSADLNLLLIDSAIFSAVCPTAAIFDLMPLMIPSMMFLPQLTASFQTAETEFFMLSNAVLIDCHNLADFAEILSQFNHKAVPIPISAVTAAIAMPIGPASAAMTTLKVDTPAAPAVKKPIRPLNAAARLPIMTNTGPIATAIPAMAMVNF